MWVHEEYIGNRKLTEIINTEHENVKYLPGIKLPSNIVAVDDLLTNCRDADVIVFGMPHQFLDASLRALEGRVPRDTVCVSLIKGMCAVVDLLFILSAVHKQEWNFLLRARTSTLKQFNNAYMLIPWPC
jgi:glycerol-3-phosphate dehydrogenase (NAD+)